jgi:hypothetical protein
MSKVDVGTIPISKDSLCHQLVHLKDKLPRNTKSGVIYHAPCAGKLNKPCDDRYIGEAERSMDVRFKEHHNKAKLPNSNNYSSAIEQHAHESGHHYRAEDITFLDTLSNKMARGIKEAIYTRALDPLPQLRRRPSS